MFSFLHAKCGANKQISHSVAQKQHMALVSRWISQHDGQQRLHLDPFLLHGSQYHDVAGSTPGAGKEGQVRLQLPLKGPEFHAQPVHLRPVRAPCHMDSSRGTNSIPICGEKRRCIPPCLQSFFLLLISGFMYHPTSESDEPLGNSIVRIRQASGGNQARKWRFQKLQGMAE